MSEIISDQYFERAEIRIDGKYFVRCTFQDCMFHYGATDGFSFTDCQLRGTKLTFDQCASRTLGGLAVFYHSGFSDAIEITVERIRQMSTMLPERKKN